MRRASWSGRVVLLIAVVAAGAGAAIGLTGASIAEALRDHPAKSCAFLGMTLALQLFSIRVRGKGSVGVSAVGLIAAAIALGAGPAMAIGVVAALAQWVRSRGLAHRALFDAANFALAAGAAGGVYHSLVDGHSSAFARVAAGILAGVAYALVNNGLLCLAMSASESVSPVSLWRARFSWAMPYLAAFGPLAVCAAFTYGALGPSSLLVLLFPPVFLALALRQAAQRLSTRTV